MGFLADILGLNKAQFDAPQIPTMGVNAKSPFMGGDASYTGDTPLISPSDIVQTQAKTMTEASPMLEREGMFGIKGPARDILGLLGDFSLMRSGDNPIFTPQWSAEHEADRYSQAAQNFVNDPMGTIRSMAKAGYGKEAQALYQQYQTNQINAAKAGAEIGQSNSTTRKNNYEVDQDARGRIGNVLEYANEKNYPQYLALAKQMGKRAGVTVDLPDQYDPVAVKEYIAGGLTRKDSEAQDLGRDKARADVIIRGAKLKLDTYDKITDNAQAATNEQGRTNRAIAAEQGRATRAKEYLKQRGVEEAGRNTRAAARAPSFGKQDEGQLIRQNGHTFKIVNGKPVFVE